MMRCQSMKVSQLRKIKTFLKSKEKHHHFSVAYLFYMLAIHIWWVMSTIYPGCIALQITAPSGATQIGYPGYWELLYISYYWNWYSISEICLSIDLASSMKLSSIFQYVFLILIIYFILFFHVDTSVCLNLN